MNCIAARGEQGGRVPASWLTAAGLILAVALAPLGGCAKPNLIPNTKIQDTEANREILQVMEAYRRAVEQRNAAAVLALAHPTYQDNSGTPEGSDDLDYNGLKALLSTRFQQTTKVRYRIEYQDVETRGSRADVYAYIDATFLYEPPDTNQRWRRLTDHNRFQLVKDGEKWQFTSGL